MAVSSSCDSKPLGQGKDYHYSVLYNYYEGPASKRKDDHLISWKVLKALEEKLSDNGYDKVMYHDIAIPGSNMFDMLFNMVNKSEKIVVLLTPDFLRNGWHKYSQQAAMKKLIDKHVNTSIVPIGININRQDISENVGLSVRSTIFVSMGYEKVDKSVERVFDQVLKAFNHKPTEGHCKQNIVQPVQTSSPHNNRRNCDCSSLEVDDDAENGDREVSRGNAASTNRNAQEQFADSNSANQQDDGYKSDCEESEHTPMSIDLSSMHLGGTQTGPTQLVTSKSDPELPKRQEGDGAHGKAITESNRKKGEPGKEQANVSSEPPQTLQSVQVSEPHDNHTNDLNNSILEVDAPQSADDAEDGDREASCGNAASTKRNAQEQFADSNSANQQNDDYKRDYEETELMSNDISLGGTQIGLTQLVNNKLDLELPKRQELDAVPRETITDSNRNTDELGEEQANVPSEPPQTFIGRSLSWLLEMLDYFY